MARYESRTSTVAVPSSGAQTAIPLSQKQQPTAISKIRQQKPILASTSSARECINYAMQRGDISIRQHGCCTAHIDVSANHDGCHCRRNGRSTCTIAQISHVLLNDACMLCSVHLSRLSSDAFAGKRRSVALGDILVRRQHAGDVGLRPSAQTMARTRAHTTVKMFIAKPAWIIHSLVFLGGAVVELGRAKQTWMWENCKEWKSQHNRPALAYDTLTEVCIQ